MTDPRQQSDEALRRSHAEHRSHAEELCLVPLEAVLCTEKLNRRPTRGPDYETENRALVTLAQALADSPRTVLQTLVNTILEVFKAGSAGVSLLTKDEKSFVWPAIAGMWQPHIGGGTPRDFGPCGDVLDCNAPLLFKRFERRYPYLLAAMPLAEECLLVPFYVNRKAVGTIWVIAHDDRRKFDAEDLRQLESLGRFASAAYQAMESLDAALELGRVALGLSEDAARSGLALEKLEFRESEERYRALFESIDEGFCIIEKVDGDAGELPDFRFVEANPAFAVQFGVSGVVGKTIRQVAPGEAEEWFVIYDTVLRTGEPKRLERSLVTQQRVLELHAFRVRDETHRRVGVSFYDITERKRMEEALRRSEGDLRDFVENASVGLQRVGPDGTALWANQTELDLLGCTREEYIGHHIAEFYADQPVIEDILVRLTGGETLHDHEARLRCKDGAIRHVLISSNGFFEEGKLIHTRCFTRDITERKQATEALRTSEERVRLALDAAELGTFNIDPATNTLTADKRFQAIFGSPADRIGYEQAFAIVHPEDRAEQRDAVVAATRPDDPAPYIAEYRVVHPDGSVRWVSAMGRANFGVEERGSQRQLLSFDGTVADITERKQAEEALRLRTAQFETLLNSAPIGVYLIDADFRVRQVNPAALPAFGDIPDLIGRDFAEVMQILWPNAKANETIEQFRHTLETGESCFVPELIAKRADRQTTEYYEWQISRIPLPDGRHGVVCYFRDISERVLAQEKIRENEWRLCYATESARLTFVEIDLASGVARTPENFAAVMGYLPPPEQEADGSVGARIMLEHVVPHDRPMVDAALQEFFGGKPVGKLDYRVLGDDQIERWIETSWSTVFGPDGKPLKSFATNLDITERRQSEAALRQSEERFRALFDWGPIAMYSCDSAGIIQEYNRGAVKLWEREPRLGDTDEQFRGSFKTYLPDGTFLPYARTAMTRVLKGEIPAAHDMEIVVERLDGSRITLVVNVVPLKNGRGEVTGAITCFFDISERTRLERKTQEQAQALADLDRRKDEFLAMLSHELRNPLAPISNALYILRLQKNEEPLQQQARNIIERQVGQLKHLVDDLLEVSRITTGRVQLRQDRVAVGGIVERAVETAHPLIGQRRHELNVSLPPQPIWLHADAARLEQVVVNLLTNAAKYADEGGHIWLTVQQEGDTVVLRVRDTGIGIAPELLPRIFDLFTQAERSLDRSQGGLGIGLSLVQRLVELHGGTVEAYSVLGQGSEFVVRLPVMLTSMAPSTSPSPSPSTETDQPPGKCCRVLVVDDNVDLAQSLAILLKAVGHDVRIAYDGPTALEAALDYRPDMVLLDIGLPGLTGYEVAKRMRQQAVLGNVVLVAMTGYGQETDRQRSQEAGFDHHLVKPADFGEVQKILATVRRRRRDDDKRASSSTI